MTKPPKTRGAMDPPSRPLFLLSRIAIGLVIALAIAGVTALTGTTPAIGWAWFLGAMTTVATVALLIRDVIFWEGP